MRLVTALLTLVALFVGYSPRAVTQDVSGDYYDWHRTLNPELPWHHDYSQTLVMKLFMSSSDEVGNVKVYLTFDDALEVIRKLDNLTLGIPKIVYLVGWQFNGHNSGYPSWSVVNGRLKRPQDKTALQSLKWLMEKAQQYHTIVSLHINMFDAYMDSPLWRTYDQDNIILKDKNGVPIKGEVFHGVQSYQISYAQEWRHGLTQRRIDHLLRIVPQLKKAGTIHVDAFHSIQPARPNDPLSNPFVGTTVDDEIAAQRKIFRYWRKKGLDVTAEADIYELRKDPFIGLQPMAWWFDLERFRRFDWLSKPADFTTLPPSLYIGTPMHAEEEVKADPEHLSGILNRFCEKVVPWFDRNNGQSNEDNLDAEGDDGDVFLPALWLPSTMVACSEKGYMSKTWLLPRSWRQVASVKLMHITTDGLSQPDIVPVKDGNLEISLKPGEVVAIQN